MIKSVAKHKYIKGRNGKERGCAHINYIAHRRGEDREQGGRKFFNKEREGIEALEVKQLMYEYADERGVIMHKLILSPGLNADAKEYTRELMERLEREKGLELEWRAVVHDNTEHRHAHVVIMGKDKDGHLVRLDKNDYRDLRRFGDEYLDREHKLDRYLDREMHDLLRSKEYDRGGDEVFKRLMFGDYETDREREKKEREQDPDRDRREFEQFDRDMKRAIEAMNRAELYPVRGEQRTIEQAGRLSDHHTNYAINMAKERLEKIAGEQPELLGSIRAELEYMQEVAQETRLEVEVHDRGLDNIFGFKQGRQPDNETEGAMAADKTMEIDRLTRSEQEQVEDRRPEREDDFEFGSGLGM